LTKAKTQIRKKNLFNNGGWENWISTYQRLKLDTYLSPYTKINSKWIKDLNVKCEMTREKHRGNTLRYSHGF
jgi:hypothetical protein